MDNKSLIEKEYDAKIEHIPPMLDFIGDFIEENNLPLEFKNKMEIVGDELLSNVIKYGYNNNGGQIIINLLFDGKTKEFVMSISDYAPEFNHRKKDHGWIYLRK